MLIPTRILFPQYPQFLLPPTPSLNLCSDVTFSEKLSLITLYKIIVLALAFPMPLPYYSFDPTALITT